MEKKKKAIDTSRIEQDKGRTFGKTEHLIPENMGLFAASQIPGSQNRELPKLKKVVEKKNKKKD